MQPAECIEQLLRVREDSPKLGPSSRCAELTGSLFDDARLDEKLAHHLGDGDIDMAKHPVGSQEPYRAARSAMCLPAERDSRLALDEHHNRIKVVVITIRSRGVRKLDDSHVGQRFRCEDRDGLSLG